MYVESEKICYRQSYLQSRNRDTDIDKVMVTEGIRGRGELGVWD